MRATLALAARGLGSTWPNPTVGCVLVSGGRVVGRGWTQPGGRPHAEAVALERAGALARGATAYVSLEPCAHHGVTPPCADALIAAGIAAAVVAMPDPNPAVAGGGIDRLRAAGIGVEVGLMEAEARALNAGFLLAVEHGRPLVTLKTATTLDGRIAVASGASQWLTGAACAPPRPFAAKPARCRHGRSGNGGGRQSHAHLPSAGHGRAVAGPRRGRLLAALAAHPSRRRHRGRHADMGGDPGHRRRWRPQAGAARRRRRGDRRPARPLRPSRCGRDAGPHHAPRRSRGCWSKAAAAWPRRSCGWIWSIAWPGFARRR